MLLELTVENYAVVEKVRVRFHRGLNLLTGETGSGKSIVVDALALLLGGRAAAEMVRTGRGAGAHRGNLRSGRARRFRRAWSRKTANSSSSARSCPTASRGLSRAGAR